MLDYLDANTKQTVITALNSLESEGITDIRIARTRLYKEIEDSFRLQKLKMTKEQKLEVRSRKAKFAKSKEEVRKIPEWFEQLPTCPSCGKGRIILSGKKDIDGSIIEYEICSVLGKRNNPEVFCGYSKMVVK
jgi:hypothetical protein